MRVYWSFQVNKISQDDEPRDWGTVGCKSGGSWGDGPGSILFLCLVFFHPDSMQLDQKKKKFIIFGSI